MNTAYERLGLGHGDILLPCDVDLKKWAVIACDQFTSDRGYWREVADDVGSAPSTYHITLPEIDLKQADTRLPHIHAAMEQYLRDVLRPVAGWVYVRRQTQRMLRRGLVLPIDLECYDYMPGAHSLIRATEGTILDRLPPRLHIRRDALVESPHILLLLDDPTHTVIEPLDAMRDNMTALYDFSLMMDGGELSGWQVDAAAQAQVTAALEALLDPATQHAKYGDITAPLLYAAGDGNHSLATARAFWLELRDPLSPAERTTHPARYALVELINLHDAQLHFEPIHRVLFHADAGDVADAFTAWLDAHPGNNAPQTFAFDSAAGRRVVEAARPPHTLQVGTLQLFLDDYLQAHPECTLDYIHGDIETLEIGRAPGNVAMLLTGIPKADLFKSVLLDGVLPRKTFSLGEARDKRYYMECRAITR